MATPEREARIMVSRPELTDQRPPLREFLHENDPCLFARERLRIPLEPAQENVLRATGPRVILNCTRQWGKSTLGACMALHRAHHRPGALILIVGPIQRQSSELVEKIRDLAIRMGYDPKGDGHNECSIRLPNGSRIVSLPGVERNVRGFSSASLILVDEASRVPDILYAPYGRASPIHAATSG